MDNWIAYFADDGSPVLHVWIRSSDSESNEFIAIIDTGFTGFISLPQRDAERLGIVPTTRQNVVFADNSEHSRWIALGTVVVGGDSREGTIFLEPFANEVLLGMEFIQAFGRSLVLDTTSNIVEFLSPETSRDLMNTLSLN